MTTIAFDGLTLAGDRQSTFGGTPARTRKVFRLVHGDEVWLTGCGGTTGECQAYFRWARNPKRENCPSFKDILVLSIDQKFRIWCMAEDMHWYRIGKAFWAIGSGANYALGAMAAGKSAREAVQIATKLDTSTGYGVDVVRFQ